LVYGSVTSILKTSTIKKIHTSAMAFRVELPSDEECNMCTHKFMLGTDCSTCEEHTLEKGL